MIAVTWLLERGVGAFPLATEDDELLERVRTGGHLAIPPAISLIRCNQYEAGKVRAVSAHITSQERAPALLSVRADEEIG
jgi:hypothetical protein